MRMIISISWVVMPKVHSIHLCIQSRKCNKKLKKQRKSLYSIEFGPPVDTIRGRPDILDYEDGDDRNGGQLSPKPMTPRRVKRRSVMTRGTNSRQSTTSRRSHTSNRSSVRNSRRKYHHPHHPNHPHHQQNPVTKLIDQQQNVKPFASFTHTDNPNLTASNLKTLNHDLIAAATMSASGGSGPMVHGGSNKMDNYSNFSKSVSPDPIYYNTIGSSTMQLQQSWNTSNSPTHQIGNSSGACGSACGVGGVTGGGGGAGGHFNPTYQHSTPNLSNSNEHVDELYNNRPPSVRSSYSNFHGTRPISSYNPTTENVFAGISGGGGGHIGTSTGGSAVRTNLPPVQSSSSPVQPQVPSRTRTSSRESIRSMAFLNSGPPAYNLNYHTPPDSETTM